MNRAGPERRSLFGEILDWMLAPLLLIWPMSVALTWLVAQGIANRPFDRELGDRVRAIAQQMASEPGPPPMHRDVIAESARWLLSSDGSEGTDGGNNGDRYAFQALGWRGEFIAGDADLPVPVEGTDPGGQVHFRDDALRGEPVRVAWLWLPADGPGSEYGALVQVAETLDRRKALATEIIKGVILPQFAILPLAVLLTWLALSRGIRPLAQLQQRIRQRASSDLSPIDERGVPDEVTPLVAAINDLLLRLDQSIATQRHFLADAAHQLKTPLAGLRMQAELAVREIDHGRGDAASMKHSLEQIALSSQRAAHMVNQLLAMARAEDREQALRQEPTDLAAIVREAVQDFVPKAIDKHIDLGFEGPPDGAPAPLVGHALLLREMTRNLIDNALQYTPPGGTVTVRVNTRPDDRSVTLQVEDTGPGIAEAERALIFQPFYRALGTQVDGSGLGLAIVAEVAQQHGAQITLEDTRSRDGPDAAWPGVRFTVQFPPP